jgi:formylglycine-generating enzyme required for sulfatase activity
VSNSYSRSFVRFTVVACLCLCAARAGSAPQIPSTDEVNQPLHTNNHNPNAIGVVIGIGKYLHHAVPEVKFAEEDANSVRAMLTETLGYDASRVFLRMGGDASYAGLHSFFQELLKPQVIASQSDVFVFYSGHGMPNNERDPGKQRVFLVPWDYDPQLEPSPENAMDVEELREILRSLGARSVTLVLDACFTGQSEAGPVRKGKAFVRFPDAMMTAPGIAQIAAGGNVTTWDEKNRHGVLTYYFLRGLRGEGADEQGQVTFASLKAFFNRATQGSPTPQVTAPDMNAMVVNLGTGVLEVALASCASCAPDAELFVDGASQGTIMAGKSWSHRLRPGTHEVEVRKDLYRPFRQTILLIADATNRLPVGPLPQNLVDIAVPPVTETPPNSSMNAPKPIGGNDADDKIQLSPQLSLEDKRLKWEFVTIPAGDFMMGCSQDDAASGAVALGDDKECFKDENHRHRVLITRSFQMNRYLVTQDMWESVMGNGSNPSYFKRGDLPVERVSWENVQDFLKRLNDRNDGFHYRLPTEAEWEFAARAGNTGARYGKVATIAWYENNSGGQTQPVGTREPNAWGLYDMLGNVWEWVQDWYDKDYYGQLAGAATDPKGPQAGEVRVLRGGSWDESPRAARVSNRYAYKPAHKNNDIGFRCVREAVTSEARSSGSLQDINEILGKLFPLSELRSAMRMT